MAALNDAQISGIYSKVYSGQTPDQNKISSLMQSGYADSPGQLENYIRGGSSGGGDLNAGVNAATANSAKLANLFASQRGESNNFLGRYTGAINNQETSSAMADRIGSELGLPQMRANSQGLQNTLFNLPSTYSAATTGHDVNANQLSRIVGQKQSELAPAAALAQSNVSSAENSLNTRLGYGQADQAKALLPYGMESNLMSDTFARETTGYTNAMQGELDAIIGKMNAGVTLSEGEKNRAQALASAEMGYQNALKVAEINKKQDSPYISVGEGNSIFDPKTGRFVATAPKTYAPNGGSAGGNGW